MVSQKMTMIPLFVLGLFSLLLTGCGGPTAEPEIHLIPDSLRGQVVLHHQVKEAPELPREGNARSYRIPADGILQTSTAANYGIRPPKTMEFYLVSATGERKHLPVKGHDRIDDPATLCIIGGYQVGADFYYFVDALQHAGKYKNPAINGTR